MRGNADESIERSMRPDQSAIRLALAEGERVYRTRCFERYDDFGQDERGIAREGGPTIAWFKDPAGARPLDVAATSTK